MRQSATAMSTLILLVSLAVLSGESCFDEIVLEEPGPDGSPGLGVFEHDGRRDNELQ